MKYLKSFTISRPMLFLCGPAIPSDKDLHEIDRRVVLSKKIYNYGDDKFKPLPFVVDDLFSDKPNGYISEYNLNVGLLEEIVANISLRTYIFLDTMSTSYELGLFSNSKQRNNVVMLLDDEYKKRIICSVGEYIEKATKRSMSNFIQYKGRYNGRGHLFFKDDILPLNIDSDVQNCLNDYKTKNQYNISFSKGFDKQQSVGNIQYEVNSDNHKLVFKLDFKTLFYLLCAIYTPSDYGGYDSKADSQVNNLKSILLSSFINLSNDKQVIRELYFYKLDVEFFDYNYQIPEIISNMKFIIFMMKTTKVTHIPSTILLPATAEDFKYYNSEKPVMNAKDFFGINDNEYKILCDYKKHPIKYVHEFYLSFKKKIRKIQTYKNTRNGKFLQGIHEKIFNHLKSILPTSDCSFAYKEEKNAKKCLEHHLESNYFLKLDIHDFFHSISKRKLFNEFLVLQKSLIGEFIKKYQITTYWSIFDYDNSILNTILNGLMWKRSLPIGFVTSPILSDFYLFNDFDKKLSEEDLIYTRYADDILISSSSEFSFDVERLHVSTLLESKYLVLNEQKTGKFSLVKTGDSFKFLGLVLTRTDNGNVIKISKSYIIEVSQLIEKHFDGSSTKYEWLDKINGKVNYIKSISESSYRQLVKIYKLHHNMKSPDYFKTGAK